MLTHCTHPDATAGHLNLTPTVLVDWLSPFRTCFSAPVWSRILVLVAGAVLAPGKRTVSQTLRIMGLASNAGFSRFHEVLNRARWDGRAVARTLLVQVLGTALFYTRMSPPAGNGVPHAKSHGMHRPGKATAPLITPPRRVVTGA
jgi:hypothetical protein